MWNTTGRVAIAVLAIGISFYPLVYLFSDDRVGLLENKSDVLYFSSAWQTAFYLHILFGGIALLTGWIQFFPAVRKKYLKMHRVTGTLYTLAVLIGGSAGIYLSIHASGGLLAKSGFFLLGVGWTASAIGGYFSARMGSLTRHEVFMIYSYAFCFAAVTLRIWLPILIISLGSFEPAYRIVAWLCWVPNIMVAYWIISAKRSRALAA